MGQWPKETAEGKICEHYNARAVVLPLVSAEHQLKSLLQSGKEGLHFTHPGIQAAPISECSLSGRLFLSKCKLSISYARPPTLEVAVGKAGTMWREEATSCT